LMSNWNLPFTRILICFMVSSRLNESVTAPGIEPGSPWVLGL
jgi:hypothetical protein